MKTAICLSGELRTLDVTIGRLKSKIFNNFSDYDLFYYGWKDDANLHHLKLLEKLPNTKNIILEDRIDVPSHKTPRGEDTQAIIRQLHCLQQSHKMQKDYGQYDIVVRVRPDYLVMAEETGIDENQLKPNTIYLPNHDHHYGYNDRFYYGDSDSMDIVSNRRDSLDYYTQMGGISFYEALHKFVIDYNELNVEFLPMTGVLLRNDKSVNSDLTEGKNIVFEIKKSNE